MESAYELTGHYVALFRIFSNISSIQLLNFEISLRKKSIKTINRTKSLGKSPEKMTHLVSGKFC